MDGLGSTGRPGVSAGLGSEWGIGFSGGSSTGSSNGVSSGRVSWHCVTAFHSILGSAAERGGLRFFWMKDKRILLDVAGECFAVNQRHTQSHSAPMTDMKSRRGPGDPNRLAII